MDWPYGWSLGDACAPSGLDPEVGASGSFPPGKYASYAKIADGAVIMKAYQLRPQDLEPLPASQCPELLLVSPGLYCL